MANMRKVIEKKRDVKNSTKSGNFSDAKVTIIICIAMILLAYGVSALIYHFTKQPSTISEVKQYNISASTAFDMPESEYYVMFYDKNGTDAIVLNALVDKYRKSNKGTLYIVDLSKDYNKSIVSDTPNSKASHSSELKISGSTLLKIKAGQNVGYYENILLIEKELN